MRKTLQRERKETTQSFKVTCISQAQGRRVILRETHGARGSTEMVGREMRTQGAEENKPALKKR